MIHWLKMTGLALTLMLGLGLGLTGAAAAGTGPLPPFKFAPSARFDLTGSITVGPSVQTLAGPGMLAGDHFQQDLTVTSASGPAVTLNQIQIGSLYYFKLTGSPQWQVIDLSQTPGNVPNIQSNIPGLNGFNPNGGQRTYEAALQAQMLGPAMINGAATTKYQADVDVAALYTSLGTPPAQAAQIAAVSKLTLTVWVGDADQILYQQRVVLNSKAPAPGGGLIDVAVDFTITYRDFGTAVPITAPADVVPYVPGGAASPGPVEVMRAFYDALNSGDYDKARALVAPGLVFDFDAGTEFALTQTLEDIIPGVRDHAAHFTLLDVQQTAPDTVVATITISASDLPSLPHPYTTVDTAHVVNGRFVSYVGKTTAQTLAELRALPAEPAPGMPKSGVPNPLGWLLLALGGLCLGTGIGVLRSRRLFQR